eukprot:1042915-Alexandrium_andersonii.AAC.1
MLNHAAQCCKLLHASGTTTIPPCLVKWCHILCTPCHQNNLLADGGELLMLLLLPALAVAIAV